MREINQRTKAGKLVIAASILAAFPSWAQPPVPSATAAELPGATPVGFGQWRQFDMPSEISGHTYRIFISAPDGPAPAGGFPVVYVTDANGLFPIAAGQARTFDLDPLLRRAIVIGVGYPVDDQSWFERRSRDLTPSPPAPDMFRPSGTPALTPENTGGAERFYRFLVEELRPVIAKTFPAASSDQSLFGHSLGGLFVLHTLFNHPESFRRYLISSPAIWWNNRVVLRGEAAFLRRVAAGEISPQVQVTVGADESIPPVGTPPGMSRADLKRLIAEAEIVDNARDLARRFSSVRGGPAYRFRYIEFSGEEHLSVIPAAISRGLAFAIAP